MKSYIVIVEGKEYLAVEDTHKGEEAALIAAGKEIAGYVTAKTVWDAIQTAIQFGYVEGVGDVR